MSSAPTRRRPGARIPRAELEPPPHRAREPSRAAPRSEQPGGGLSPPLPASGTGCRGAQASFLGLGCTVSQLRSPPPPHPPRRKRPEPPRAAVYKAPSVRRREGLGEPGRQEDPQDTDSRLAPGSGRLQPHEDPQAGAESLEQPGRKSCGGLRALDRSVPGRDEGAELEAGGCALTGPPGPPHSFPRPLARSPPPGARNSAGVILHFS